MKRVMDFFRRGTNSKSIKGLGLDMPPGSDHYRAYVGPSVDYDLISAMSFNILTSAGIRQHHKMLDIGCGSLRVGRLFIPYLNAGNYCGIEPNQWLIDDGISNEVGQDLIEIKRPLFLNTDHIDSDDPVQDVDYALAQSIFSHCGPDLIDQWLEGVKKKLSGSGVLFATFLVDDKDFDGEGWVYPQCVRYRVATIEGLAKKNGLKFQLLNWAHPRQKWAAFYNDGYNAKLISDGEISWNKFLSQTYEDKWYDK